MQCECSNSSHTDRNIAEYIALVLDLVQCHWLNLSGENISTAVLKEKCKEITETFNMEPALTKITI